MSFHRCEKCNSSSIHTEKKQSRLADEEASIFQQCIDCGWTKRIDFSPVEDVRSAPRLAFQRDMERRETDTERRDLDFFREETPSSLFESVRDDTKGRDLDFIEEITPLQSGDLAKEIPFAQVDTHRYMSQSAADKSMENTPDELVKEYEREKKRTKLEEEELVKEYEREKKRQEEREFELYYGLSETDKQKELEKEFELYYGVRETEKQKEREKEFLLLLDPFYLDIKEISYYEGPIPEKETLQSLMSLIGKVDPSVFSKLIDTLLGKGLNIDTDVLLLEAVRKGEHEFIDIALSLTQDANKSLSRALSLASGLSRSEIVDALIDAGADVSVPTPMLNAIRNGRVKNVKLLLSARACVNKEILKEAERSGNAEILRLIYGETGRDVSSRLESGRQLSSFLPSSHTCRL